MKHTKYLSIFITFIAFISFSQCSMAQTNSGSKNDADNLAFKNMAESKHFNFIAQTVTPLRGRFRNLTTIYNVRVSNDTLISYLPFFGRAYTATINETESPLNFTSTDFSYTVTQHKKSGWDIVIRPKDNTTIQQYSFTIFSNGTANLNVINTSRDPISFTGYIQKENKKQ